MTYDGTTANFFIDGAPAGGGPLTLNTPVGAILKVGGYGTYDEVSVYPTALAPSRIAAHNSAPSGLAGGPLGSSELLGGANKSIFCAKCAAQSAARAATFAGLTTIGAYPVDASTGNFWHTFSDLSIGGRGMPLGVSRTYNSAQAPTDSAFGFGWSHSYDMNVTVDPVTSAATVHQENAATVTFALAGGVYSAPPRDETTLVKNGDGSWTFTRQGGQIIAFDPSGRLISMKDLNGYSTTLAYTASTITVTDPAGRTLTFTYTGSHITSVADSSSPARTVKYQYNDSHGNLTDVIDVAGGHTQFSYDSAHLDSFVERLVLMSTRTARGGFVMLVLGLLLTVVNLIVLGTFAFNSFQGGGRDILFGALFLAVALAGPAHAVKAAFGRRGGRAHKAGLVVRDLRELLLAWGGIAFLFGLVVSLAAAA